MRKIDFLLSFLYPITVLRTSSPCNRVLDIMLSAGKYSLNSENTNYSYGSLHTLFEKTFRKLKLNWNEINHGLILGFGTGSVAGIINKYNQNCIIDGVEIDMKVIELGEKYFNTNALKNVSIHCVNAVGFLQNCQKKYDLIVIDAYADIHVPEEIESEQFLVCVKNAMNIGGKVIFNKFNHSKASRNQIPKLKELYEKVFENVEVLTIMTTGKIFIAEKLAENR